MATCNKCKRFVSENGCSWCANDSAKVSLREIVRDISNLSRRSGEKLRYVDIADRCNLSESRIANYGSGRRNNPLDKEAVTEALVKLRDELLSNVSREMSGRIGGVS